VQARQVVVVHPVALAEALDAGGRQARWLQVHDCFGLQGYTQAFIVVLAG
jgi:hypothetical protein